MSLVAIAAQLRALQATLPRDRALEPRDVRAWLDAMTPPVPVGLEVREVVVPGLPGRPDVRAEWVVPTDADPTRRLVYLHGGGYVAGSPRSHRGLVARIAKASGRVALVPDYRLAPEHPCPAALDDARAALAAAFSEGPHGAQAATDVALAGDSAGGGLALSTAVAARDEGARPPSRIVTLSAWTDLACTGDSFASRADVEAMLPAALVREGTRHVLGDLPADDPRASPLYAELAGLPPLLMQVGDAEVLLDDTRRVAARARDAGVAVIEEVYPDAFHVFQAFAGMIPEGRAAIASIAAFLAGSPPTGASSGTF